jgi:hypothetical protein
MSRKKKYDALFFSRCHELGSVASTQIVTAVIPPMEIGGLLRSHLQKEQQHFLNPPDGNRGIVKAQPSSLREQSHFDARKVGL